MKALSISQPYALLVLLPAYDDEPIRPLKNVENRSWPVPKNFQLPQRIYVHAPLSFYDVTLQEVKDRMMASQWTHHREKLFYMYRQWDLYKYDKQRLKQSSYFGHILGEITITECRFRFGEENTELYSPWHFPGQYGFYLSDTKLYEAPIPYKGAQKFFEVNLTEHK